MICQEQKKGGHPRGEGAMPHVVQPAFKQPKPVTGEQVGRTLIDIHRAAERVTRKEQIIPYGIFQED